MSNFFQNSLKKQKNCLGENSRLKNNDNKTDKSSSNDSSKKKNTKKFMISPVKESLKENNEKKGDCKYERDSNTESSLNENDHIIQNINKNSFSFKYNRHVSPLYTNTESVKKSISSTLCYEQIYNPYENISYNYTKKDNDNFEINSSINSDENILVNNENTFEISCIQKIGSQEHKLITTNLEDSIRDNIIDNFSQTSSLNNTCISFNNNNVESEKNETSKLIDKNYTTINKLNFNSLSSEPTLTYIQKDKFKLYYYIK